MPTIPSADQTNYVQLLHGLLDLLLHDAYHAAATMDEKSAIVVKAGDVHDILTELNQGALDSDTAEFATLKTEVDGLNRELKDMKSEIDDWVKDVGIATQVVGAIDQAVNAAAKVFTL